MSINGFIPEIWSALIMDTLEKSLVFGAPGCCNRDYEGNITAGGDKVKITSISRPTVATYTKGVTVITPQQLTDAQRNLEITESKYFAFEVEDIDKAQAAGGGQLLQKGMEGGGYALRDTADQFIAALYESNVDSDNVIGTTTINTKDLAEQYLAELMVRLDQKNVPSEGRYCIAPPWFIALLMRGTAVNAAGVQAAEAAFTNGFVTRQYGFDLYKSNNCTLVTGDDYRVCAGHPLAVSYAEQINKTEAYRPESSFSDAIKGLHLYGGKVVYPEALATLLASKT